MAELFSSAAQPSIALPSDDLPSVSGAILPSSDPSLIDISSSQSTSSALPSETTGTPTSGFGFGINQLSSSVLAPTLLLPSASSSPILSSSAAIPSDVIVESALDADESSTTTIEETLRPGPPSSAAAFTSTVVSSTAAIPSSQIVSLQNSIPTTSSQAQLALSSAQPLDDQSSSSPALSTDVGLFSLDGESVSQKHVTVTLTSSVPSKSSASSRKSVVTSSTTLPTSSTAPVPTIAKISSSAQAPVSAPPASVSAGNAQADGSNEKAGAKVGQTNLSSFAIVGIVGGILVGFVIVYLIWYRWRRNKTRKALGASPTDSTFQPNEKHRDADGATIRSSFGNDVDPFDDSRTEYTAYPSDRYYEDRRYDPRTEYDEWDGQTQLWDQRGTHTQYLEHRDDADIEAELAGEPASRAYAPSNSSNPFEVSPLPPVPAVPPIPSSPTREGQPRTRSMTKQPTTRPSTKASDPFGFDRSTKASMPVSTDGYDSLYEKYDHSRPGSEYDRRTTLQTPATAALVPWLRQHRKSGPEAVPPVPAVPLHQQGGVHPSKAKGVSRRNHPEVNEAETRRVAPVAAMAQTPVGKRQGSGWPGVIPAFR